MTFLDLRNEIAHLSNMQIGSQDPSGLNDTIIKRRVNIIKADIIGRFGGKWNANYREGWLPLQPLFSEGTATFTLSSRTVTGVSTTWSSVDAIPNNAKMLAPDGNYYRIASVTSDTSLILSQPYQGTTTSGSTYLIWIDEYVLHPDVLTVGGFVNYSLVDTMREAWPAQFKQSFAKQVATGLSDVYEVIGKQGLTAVYSTGNVSGTVNTNILTGSGTSWMANLQPGYEITIGSTKYHVRTVDSDTKVTLYQMLASTIGSGTAYSAVGKNSVIVRFRYPSAQTLVHYWYYTKDHAFVNDNDEDWISEQYPRVIVNGSVYFSYIDKNDVARAFNSQQVYEDSIKNMRVAQEQAYTGVRTIGLYIPNEARD